MMSPETKSVLGHWLLFGGLIPGVVVGALANLSAKRRKLAPKGTTKYRLLLALEVVTTVVATLAAFVVGALSVARIGTV
jgi:uncharacterized membrane protein YedE/YeeE